MLCQELEFNGVIRQHGLDEKKVTAAYRKAVIEALRDLMAKGFVAERKFDGTRVLAMNEDGNVTLQNRNGMNYTIRLPEVVKALKCLHGKWKLDGEVIFLDPQGEEHFTGSQRRCSTQYPDPYFIQQLPIKMEMFDALEVDGINIERKPYLNRKATLQRILERDRIDSTIEYVPFEKNLSEAWNEAIKRNREGLIVKQLESPYEEGDRSYNWLKVKNWRFEACNVVGFTAGERARSAFFGALVLAKDDKFRGLAGSGFNEWELRRFKDIFSDAPTMPKPYSDEQVGNPYTAVKVDLQVLVKYYQITDNNVFRFPIFINAN
jgi:bifunctional non-homologous end joining protein LigD